MDPGNCNTCHKYFDSIVKRNIHIQRMHTYGPEKQQRTYECVTCGKVLRTRSNLSQHMRIQNKNGMEKMNPVPSVLPCNNCKKLCERGWNLKGHTILKHMKVALGPRVWWSVYMKKSPAKKLSCSICGMLFRRKTMLMQYMYGTHRSRRKGVRVVFVFIQTSEYSQLTCQHFLEKFNYELEEL